jgi:hypothetical protein
VLTNSFITPTAMGIAILYPTELTDPDTGDLVPYDFARQQTEVQKYTVALALH